MYHVLLRFLPTPLANLLMVLWYTACVLAIVWYWDGDIRAFRYLEL